MIPSDKPLRRVSLLLYKDDVDYLERRYGRGWSEQVRMMVRDNNRNHKANRDVLDQLFGEHHE